MITESSNNRTKQKSKLQLKRPSRMARVARSVHSMGKPALYTATAALQTVPNELNVFAKTIRIATSAGAQAGLEARDIDDLDEPTCYDITSALTLAATGGILGVTAGVTFGAVAAPIRSAVGCGIAASSGIAECLRSGQKGFLNLKGRKTPESKLLADALHNTINPTKEKIADLFKTELSRNNLAAYDIRIDPPSIKKNNLEQLTVNTHFDNKNEGTLKPRADAPMVYRWILNKMKKDVKLTAHESAFILKLMDQRGILPDIAKKLSQKEEDIDAMQDKIRAFFSPDTSHIQGDEQKSAVSLDEESEAVFRP